MNIKVLSAGHIAAEIAAIRIEFELMPCVKSGSVPHKAVIEKH